MLECGASNREAKLYHTGFTERLLHTLLSGRQSVFPGVNTLKVEQEPKSQKGNPMNLRGGNTVQSSALTVTEQDRISSQCRLLLTQYFMRNEQMET